MRDGRVGEAQGKYLSAFRMALVVATTLLDYALDDTTVTLGDFRHSAVGQRLGPARDATIIMSSR